MSDYTFDRLSDYEFEILAADLLRARHGTVFERFARGRDSGIDIRGFVTDHGATLAQCKHYVRSGYSSLKSAVTREADKVRSLNPDKYYLVTSVPMTPQRKAELIEVLSPFVSSPADILGQEDLNDLLREHPAIEQRHFKLWLTSVEVLSSQQCCCGAQRTVCRSH